jgi:hypothetical protein
VACAAAILIEARGRLANRSRTQSPPSGLPRATFSCERWGRWSVAYTPDWEPLADALKRVTATGINEDEARTDLCHAMADRKINVRVRIAGSAAEVYSGHNVQVPPHLKTGDLDWVRSRPLTEWWIGPMPGQHYFRNWEKRPLDLVELSTADVLEILCSVNSNVSAPLSAGQEGGIVQRGSSQRTDCAIRIEN